MVLHDLEKENLENNKGRWAWELLQNAKDSIAAEDDRKVAVQIELNENLVEFRHNGTHFTEKDVRGVINQIGSKEVEEGEITKKTGRFGTGFITTYLLSKVVEVKGILETTNGEFYKFAFPLDREGKTTAQLAPKIENAWTEFHQSATEISKNYNPNDYNTSFSYNLTTAKQKDIAQKGIEEFAKLIPFVLAFIPKIEKVEIIDAINDTTIIFAREEQRSDDKIVSISKIENDNETTILILLATNDELSIATEIEATNKGYAVKNIEHLPKLFCDFPLIGTENFCFPVVVNSFLFNPQTERDGIWLKGSEDTEVQENQRLLESAVALYEELLDYITENSFSDLYNIAEVRIPTTNEKYFDKEWYRTTILQPLRNIVLESKLVETESGDRQKVGKVFFPDIDKSTEIQEQMWQFSTNLGNTKLPAKKDIHNWGKLKIIRNCCDLCDFEYLVKDLQGKEKLETLQTCLKLNENETIEWLKNFYQFLIENKSEKLFDEYAIVPNRLGKFRKVKEKSTVNNKEQIYDILYSDELQDETLLDIEELLWLNFSVSWRENLVHSHIDITALTSAKIDIERIAKGIRNTLQAKEKTGFDENGIKAIRLLAKWFENNEEKGQEYFSDLFKNRAKLFLDTIEDKDSLYSLMQSKTSLSKLSKIALAIEKDPEILTLIEKRQQEQQEEQERNEIGEKVEQVLANLLKQYGFTVQKVDTGKDLIISLQDKNTKYEVEVKSTTRKTWVAMTATQAETAVANASNYFLCVVYKNGDAITEKYVKENAKFVTGIGNLLKNKVAEVTEFEHTKNAMSGTNTDIDLLFENELEYKYKVGASIWQQGSDFGGFLEGIKK